jgi:ABC-type multidrug transport system ATPase subunit
LAEVEALCQRCLIVHHGQLKAEKALPIQGDGRYLLEVHCSEVEGVRELPPAFESIMKGSLENEAFAKEILQKETWESDWLSITTPPLEDPSAWLKERIVAGWSIRSFAPVHLSLEQEFLKAIGDAPS